MSKTPINSTPATNGVTVPPEMWKQIQKMLVTYQEPTNPTGNPEQSNALSSPAPTSPARPLSDDKEITGPNSNNKTSSQTHSITHINTEDGNKDPISQAHSCSDENVNTGVLMEHNTNSLLVTNLDSYNFSRGGMFILLFFLDATY